MLKISRACLAGVQFKPKNEEAKEHCKSKNEPSLAGRLIDFIQRDASITNTCYRLLIVNISINTVYIP